MTLNKLKTLSDGTFIKSNGSLGIKLSTGLYFPNDNYFDKFDILDDDILEDCKVEKCCLINKEEYDKWVDKKDNMIEFLGFLIGKLSKKTLNSEVGITGLSCKKYIENKLKELFDLEIYWESFI